MAEHHYVVSGPCRDWDYATFCSNANNNAVECASEWLGEVFDELDIGESVAVTMRVVAGPAKACYGDTKHDCVAVTKATEVEYD